MTQKPLKARNWAFVAYPESLPTDWLETLKLSGLKIAISPLHDADLNADESEKKPHYHIIVIWGNTVSFSAVDRFAKQINGTAPIQLQQIRGYYRYLTHKDNPEKAQYNESDIKYLNGFNIADYVEFTKSEVEQFKKEIRKLIRSNDFTDYDELMTFLDDFDDNLAQIASNHTIHFSAILRSRFFRKKGYK